MNRALALATGSFIQTAAKWTWWTTLTFRDEVPDAAANAAARDWLRTIARDVTGEHTWFAIGRGLRSAGRPHIHMLLDVDTPLFDADLGNHLWQLADARSGFTQVERYDPERGAAWYLSGHHEWDINVACPRRRACRRARGCKVGPGPWF